MAKSQSPPRVVHLTSVHDAFDNRIFHRECRALAKAGYDVVIVGPAARDTTTNGIRVRAVRRARNRLERITLTALAVYRRALAEKGAIYHFHDPELIPIGMLLRLGGKQVVYDVHEDVPADLADKTWLPRQVRSAAAAAAHVVSRAAERAFSGLVPAWPNIARRFRPENTVVVQNYPILEDLVVERAAPYQERAPVAVYMGGLGATRGIAELVAAMNDEAMPADARLVLVGAFESEAFASKVRAMPGWSKVDERGWLDGDDLWHTVAGARVGVVTLSRTRAFVETMPTKLYEYMALGLPIVASDFPAWREVVAGSRCGLLVDPRDCGAIARAIAYLLRNAHEASEMGARGRAAVREHYNWETESRKLLALYDRLARVAG